MLRDRTILASRLLSANVHKLSGDRKLSFQVPFKRCRHARAHKQAAMCSRISARRCHDDDPSSSRFLECASRFGAEGAGAFVAVGPHGSFPMCFARMTDGHGVFRTRLGMPEGFN